MTKLTYGNCDKCKFTRPVPDHHYQKKYYQFFCVRFPPVPVSPQEIWTREIPVNSQHGCYEFKNKNTPEA